MPDKEYFPYSFFSQPSLFKWVGIVLFALLVYFPLFLHLEKPVFRFWDESRIAINAIEMSETGDFLVTHYDGEPDMWNTKPPLLVWIQLIFFKIFGYGELSFRLPSGLAGLFTCIGMMFLSLRLVRSYWYGLIATLILLTSNGYVGYHVVRTGDYDSLLTMFMFLYSIAFFMFMRTGERKYWYVFLLLIVFSVLTKGIQGLLFLPGLAMYLILRYRKVADSIRFLLLTFSGSLILASGYYFIREIVQPGYLEVVWSNEMGGRFLQTLEGHRHDFWYYYRNLIHHRYEYWYWIFPAGLFMGLLSRSKEIRELTIFSTSVIFSYWLIISSSQTKLEWYDAPMYPLMAVISAVAIYQVFDLISRTDRLHAQYFKRILQYVFAFIVVFIPYEEMVSKWYWPQENQWEEEIYRMSHALKREAEAPEDLYGYKLLFDGHTAHLDLYLKAINSKGGQIERLEYDNLAVGDSVILSQYHMYQRIQDNYRSEILDQTENIIRLRILGIK